MKFHKTNRNNRGSYRYRYTMTDEKGREYECCDTLRPGEDGVTETDILMLHRFDDAEVDNNIENARPTRSEKEKRIIKEWRERFIAEFVEKHGYEPHPEDVDYYQEEAFPKNWNLSLDSPEDYGMDADESRLFSSASYEVDYDAIAIYNRALEIVSTLSEEQQEIFRRVFVDGQTQVEVAKALGIKNKQSVTKRLNRILGQIRKKL